MATQINSFEYSAPPKMIPTAPAPPAREQVPESFISTSIPPIHTGSSVASHNFPMFSSSTPSSWSASPHGSFSNLSSRGNPTGGSMRRQLLRRIWSKEYRRMDRTGSLSPPFRRAQRRFVNSEASPEICLECQKLENYSNGCMGVKSTTTTATSNTEIKIKRQRFSTSTSNSIDKSESGTKIQMTQLKRTDGSRNETQILKELKNSSVDATTNNDLASTASNISTDLNGNELISSESENNIEKNEYMIEMEGDLLNVTTTTTTTTSTASATISDESIQRTDTRSSTSTPVANYEPMKSDSSNSQDKNNYNNNNNHTKEACDIINNMKNDENLLTADIENNSTTTTAATFPSADNIFATTSTIDKFISQLLLDNLNNVVLVEGRVTDPSDSTSNSGNISNRNPHERAVYKYDENVLQSMTNENRPVAIVSYALHPTILIGNDNETINQRKNHMDNCTTSSTEDINNNYRNSNANYYYQQYSPMDEGDETSDYSAKFSNATDDVELPANIIISVISGSVYSTIANEEDIPLVVRRLTEMPRTESMEAHPSSASINDEQEANEQSDDEISLVDSLDEPTIVDPGKNCKLIEKSQAFFVPIIEKKNEDKVTGLDVPVAASMPIKILEKLHKRQLGLQHKKERDSRQLEKNIFQNSDAITATNIDRKLENKKPNEAKKENKNPIVLKKSQKFLRSEVGLLESYKIDGKGNLQFQTAPSSREPPKQPQQTKKNADGSAVVAKPTAKTMTASKISNKKPQDATTSTTKSISIKRSQVVSNRNQQTSYQQMLKEKKKRKDVQKMTLYHQSHSDIITPDTECGPRRMYQKTEIQEGEKRIEILEIVECLNSSPDSLPPESSSSSIHSKSSGKSSKIPVPCTKSRVLKARDGNIQTFTPSKNFIKNLQQISNNSRIDQIIADLLIEALNHSSDIGIEFVKTPQNVVGQPTIRVNGSKRVALTTRRTTASSSKRSAHSGKYQQVFDSIPEEKSTLSMESSEETVVSSKTSDLSKASLVATSGGTEGDKRISSGRSTPLYELSNNSNGHGQISDNDMGVSSGKAAIQSDHDRPEVWFGFFGRSHNESPDDIGPNAEGILALVHKAGVLV